MKDSVKEYLGGKRKKREFGRCPRCKGFGLKERKYFRRNFPFGRKSGGRKVVKKVVSYCVLCHFRKEYLSEITIIK